MMAQAWKPNPDGYVVIRRGQRTLVLWDEMIEEEQKTARWMEDDRGRRAGMATDLAFPGHLPETDEQRAASLLGNAIAALDEPGVIKPVSEFQVKPRLVEMLVPFDDRLVVRPASAEEMIGSLYVPDTAKQVPAMGFIEAIGPLVKDIAIGDKVLYSFFTGTEVSHGGNDCLVLRRADLLCKVELWEGVPEVPK